jgi:exodeoxyribonuclease-1
MGLIFYDTETTGTDTFFDQILQFAAIQTDEELNVVDRFEMRCRLLPHVVPAPGAMNVTGVKVSQLTDPSLPSHYQMVRAIRAKLQSWSPALFIGWNSIKFDEDLVRQALYKTLHNPYLTNTDGNNRSDAMRIAQACSLYAPTALVFPTDANGQKIFKLDEIAPANGFDHDQAHDATGDVEATIFLCRLINKNAPDIWSSFMRFSTKAAVADFISEEQMFCLSEFHYGKPYSWIVTKIGRNQENQGEWYVYTLSVDPESLLSLSKKELIVRLNLSPKPLRRLKSNAAPILASSEDALETCSGRECSAEELERRLELLRTDAAFCNRLVSAFESSKEKYSPSPHVEKQIYAGFPEETDKELMDKFHATPWPMRTAIVDKFQDLRLREIGRRLIHLERPNLLDKTICRKHDLAIAKRLLGQGEDISWLTLPQALIEVRELLDGASGAELELLREHDQYLRKCHKQALAHVT